MILVCVASMGILDCTSWLKSECLLRVPLASIAHTVADAMDRHIVPVYSARRLRW